MGTVYLFPDTNVLLRFRLFTQVDWAALTAAKEVTVVLAHKVLTQLEHKKEGGDRPLSRRASTVVGHIVGCHEGRADSAMRPGSRFEYYRADPHGSCEAFNLDPTEDDQYIVATALAFREQNPGTKVVIVTNDASMRFMAEDIGLSVLTPPDDLRQPVLDESEKEARRLQTESSQPRQPQFQISMADGQSFTSVELPAPLDASPARIEALSRKILDRYKPIAVPVDAYGNRGYEGIQADLYNGSLPAFGREFQRFVARAIEHENVRRRSISMHIVLTNSGTASASDVVATFIPPAGVRVRASLPDAPKPVTPPEDPTRPVFGRVFDDMAVKSWRPPETIDHIPGSSASMPVRHESAEFIDDPTRPRLRLRNVLHGVPAYLGELFVTFETPQAVRSFRLKITLNAAELPRKIETELNIVVNAPKQRTPRPKRRRSSRST